MLAVGTAIFALFAVLLVRGLVRRPDPAAGTGAPSERPGRFDSRWIVGGGVILPTVVVFGLMWLTVAAINTVMRPGSADSIRIEVVGHQWWWEINYVDHGFTTANEIHIPVGVPVDLTLQSADVIHSFWIPALHGKLDALPDYPTKLVLQADEAGDYQGTCAEFCGLQHAKMGLLVVAAEQDRFLAWADAQREPAPAATGANQRGLDVFLSSDCAKCHAIRGTTATGSTGPDLTHLAARQSIGAGTRPNNSESLAAWVTDPHASKEGVAMPPSRLTGEDLAALVSYLASLK